MEENGCAYCLRGTFNTIDRLCHLSDILACIKGPSRNGLYEPILADSEREAVADLLQYLENVRDNMMPSKLWMQIEQNTDYSCFLSFC